ncbi:MAG: T9SS type A sorting domain-containing protein [Flavobacteriia bacterium]|nr:T9SS type A sorting domain-containing protein [Flavobacteriia bacterium]
MKTRTTLLLLLFTTLIAAAGPIKGGQIYWEALGNNQYVFHLEKIAECTYTPQLTDTIHASASPGIITVNYVGQTRMAPSCLSCTDDDMVLLEYESSPITLMPPSGGGTHTFYSVDCCRAPSKNLSSSVSMAIKSVMFAPGANRSSAYFDFINQYYAQAEEEAHLEAYSPELDSISIEFDHPQTEGSNGLANVDFKLGFSKDFPMSGTDRLTPYGLFISGVVDTGLWVLNFKAKSYNQIGDLCSRVGLETTMANNTATFNNAPNVYGIVSQGSYSGQDSIYYYTNATDGDQLKLQFVASDFDWATGGGYQMTTASLNHLNYSTSFTMPTLTGTMPQTGLSGAPRSRVEWTWNIDQTVPHGTHRFAIRFEDGDCHAPGHHFAVIVIKVNAYAVGSGKICVGDSIQLSSPVSGTTYSWSPATNLSNPNIANPIAFPNQTTKYTLTVDGDVELEYTVKINPLPTPILNQPNSSRLELVNNEAYHTHQFNYFYVPINWQDTIIRSTGSGFYHVKVDNGNCDTISSRYTVANDSRTSYFPVENHIQRNNRLTVDGPGDYTMNFTLNQTGPNFEVDQIVLPGAKVTSAIGQMEMRLTDQNGTLYTAAAQSPDGHSLVFNLDSSIVLTSGMVEFALLNGFATLPVKVNASYPHNFIGGSVSQVSGTFVNYSITNELVQVVFRGGDPLSQEEQALNGLSLYPQPADDYFIVEGLNGTPSYRIVDMNGRLIAEGSVDESGRVSTASISPGMYVLQVSRGRRQSHQKVVIQH